MKKDNGSVLIVTGGLLQVPAVEAARKLGLGVIITDRDPECACAELADAFYPVDIYDVEGHKELVRDLLNDGVKLRGVFTAAADPILTVATAAREAGLHHVPIQAAITCASKWLTRRALDEGGVPQPRYFVCSTPAEMYELVALLGGEAIVKATGSAGGRGHTKVHGIAQATTDVFDAALRYSKQWVLVEELLDGLEVSAEALWWNGTMTPLNAVDRPFAHRFQDAAIPSYLLLQMNEENVCESWQRAIDRGRDVAIELGHYNPALLPSSTWEEIWDVMWKTGRAIGLDEARGSHIHKCDLILTDGGVKVLETTLRLSGNWDSGRTSPLAHGVDYTMGGLKLALGDIPDLSLFMPRWYRHAVCLFYFAQPGEVKGIAKPRGAEVIVRHEVGDEVPPLDSYASLSAWVMGDGGTREMALSKAYRALCELEIETGD